MKSLAALVVLLLVVLSAAILASMTFGKGGRGFFSPDTFEVKSQSEYRLPFFDVPIYRSSFTYGASSSELLKYLIDKGYWSAVVTNNPVWVPTFHWNQQWRDGESLMYRCLHNQASLLIEWTEANPQIAGTLWPEVLAMLRTGIDDDAVAYVIYTARRVTTVDEFRRLVNNDPELQQAGIRLD